MIGAPDKTASASPSALHWLWFGSAFFVGLVLLALIPPFQTNDETLHWVKMYSVSQGDLRCEKIPMRVSDIIALAGYQQVRDGHKFSAAYYDAAFGALDRTLTKVTAPNAAACGYPAVAYVIPAILARTAQALWPQQRGALVAAFFAARIGNWLSLSLAVLLLIVAVPLARSWTLFAYSLPMMLHQCVSVNQDATIMALHCLLVIAFFRLRGARQLITIGALVVLLALMKPIYGPLSLWMTPALWLLAHRGTAQQQRRRLASLAVGVAALVGIAVWRILPFALMKRDVKLGAPPWTNPGEQIYSLFHHPGMVVTALGKQLRDHLGHGHLTGGFTSILGVFGWCQYELAPRTYYVLIAGAALALCADLLGPGSPALEVTSSWGEALVCRALPAVAPLLVILLTDVAFWVMFTPPHSPYIIGVQGRYYHGPLFLIGVGISSFMARRRWLDVVRRPWLHHATALMAFVCAAYAWIGSVELVQSTYYVRPGW